MKKVGVLFVIFLAMAAFVYFYEIVGGRAREEANSLEENLLRTRQEEITAVEISRPQGEGILLSREGAEWRLEHPLKTSADQSTVDVLLRDLSQATRDRTFPEGGTRAEEYGLHEPSMTLRIQADGKEQTLLIGDKEFTGNHVYVQFQGEPEVFLASQVLFATAGKELMEWRDKKVLVIDRDKIQAIEVVNSANTIRIIQQDEEWYLESPIQERADQNAVSGLLSTVEFGEVQEFVSDEPEELKSYGLDSPTATIRVQHEDQDGWRTLELGQQKGEYSLARNPERVSVFTVSQEIRDKLSQDVLVFRDKDVVDVEQNEIARIVIQRKEDEEIALRYEDYKWIVESPDAQKDQEALAYNFWYPINEIRFASIQDEGSDLMGFPEPDVKLSVTLDAGGQRTFVFAAVGDRYRALKVESGRQGTISKEDFEKLHFKVEDILQHE
jgi:hypothetical protein